MISNIARFTILALALLASMPSVFAGKEKCNPTAGYHYCAAQGCVRPLDKSTNKKCCNELKGFEWQAIVGGYGGACVVKQKPTPKPKKDCGVGTGMQYCAAQGCVRPMAESPKETCCDELNGFEWKTLIGGKGGSCVLKKKPNRNKDARRLRVNCGVGTGMEYCPDQGCVHPWEASKRCCRQLEGFKWEQQFGGSSCVARNNHPNRRPSNKCGRGKRYCEDQGCVYPTDLYTSKRCCKDIPGVHWNHDPNGAKCVWNDNWNY